MAGFSLTTKPAEMLSFYPGVNTAHFHARENAVDPVLILALHALQMGPDTVLLAHAFFRSHHRDLVVPGVAFHPSTVFPSALRQHLRGDRILAVQRRGRNARSVLGPGQ